MCKPASGMLIPRMKDHDVDHTHTSMIGTADRNVAATAVSWN
ncbi:hypothetical protein SXCC_01201 [Gluconacetobacter sp. SXCC-1]|nr:hypothetical protein SXCC_01201 [Gluconacetobacter sp. SXCC-1]